MRTKLVFVLTCTSDNNYIEQATIATYSAQHYNPEADIILIVDDKTEKLIAEERSEINKYISRIIVVPFNSFETMMFRSRWLKTSVRELVEGDFLFIDCDTITTRNLSEIDQFTCLMGAVPDSNLSVKEFGDDLLKATKDKIVKMNFDLDNEEYYFSSGVLYVKDAPQTHDLYAKWHTRWLDGVSKGINIDQPSLAKANIEMGHLIERIPDDYNCIIYTQPDTARDASILHFAAYRNPSWLFSNRVLNIIKEKGITEWIVPFILNPSKTYIPFRYTISKMSFCDLFKQIETIAEGAKVYSSYIDASFPDIPEGSRWVNKAISMFRKKRFRLGAVYCILPAWLSLKLKHSSAPVPNICAKY